MTMPRWYDGNYEIVVVRTMMTMTVMTTMVFFAHGKGNAFVCARGRCAAG